MKPAHYSLFVRSTHRQGASVPCCCADRRKREAWRKGVSRAAASGCCGCERGTLPPPSWRTHTHSMCGDIEQEKCAVDNGRKIKAATAGKRQKSALLQNRLHFSSLSGVALLSISARRSKLMTPRCKVISKTGHELCYVPDPTQSLTFQSTRRFLVIFDGAAPNWAQETRYIVCIRARLHESNLETRFRSV